MQGMKFSNGFLRIATFELTIASNNAFSARHPWSLT
jgi:hypothetical protein